MTFEEWVLSKGMTTAKIKNSWNEDVYHPHIESMRMGWQARDAEIAELREKISCTLGVGNGDGNLFVHGDYDSIKAAQTIILENGKLREALLEIRGVITRGQRRWRQGKFEWSPGASEIAKECDKIAEQALKGK